MGRWSQFDTDEERLPEGMRRVAYDADTQIYTYRDDTDGSYWEGAPGVQYGKLFRVRSHREEAPPLPSITIPDDVQGDEPRPHILPDYEGDGIPKAVSTAPPSLRSSTRSPAPSSLSRVTTPQRVRLRRSHYQQRKSKRLPSLPGGNPDKAHYDTATLSRTTTMSAHSHYDDMEDTIPEAPELTPSHSHSNHSDEDDDSIQKDFAANPVFTPHIHRQRRAQEREKKQEKVQQSALKRAGTISRIARYLSRAAGGNKKDGDSTAGLRSGASTAFSSTATGFSYAKWVRWPGKGGAVGRISEDSSGENEEIKVEKEEVDGIPRASHGHRRTMSGDFGSGGAARAIKPRARTMTFDEILASDGTLRGVITA